MNPVEIIKRILNQNFSNHLNLDETKMLINYFENSSFKCALNLV
jgi:hypothetical protein